MPAYQEKCEILSKRNLYGQCYDFLLAGGKIAKSASPGQFLNIRCGEKVLRRPISVCEIIDSAKAVRIVFDVRGEGTAWLAGRTQGEYLDVLGPLGHGFDSFEQYSRPLLIGGGMGVPPLLETAKRFGGKADAALGFKNACCTMLTQDFSKYCGKVHLATEDGSLGEYGYVTDCARSSIQSRGCDAIYACGPVPMLKSVAALAQEYQIDCFVSLEERMGCGIGACLVCACMTVNSEDGQPSYRHVCKDGPVFRSGEVVWP